VDATEPNYRRVPLPPAVTVRVHHGRRTEVYAGRHGCLAGRNGGPFALTGQAELIAGLLADLPELGRVTGADGPEEFVVRVRDDPAVRERVRALWRREGRVLEQAGLGAHGPAEPMADARERTA
jgi:hypothetical protein